MCIKPRLNVSSAVISGCVSFCLSTAWIVSASETTKRTTNPIRAIVDAIKFPEDKTKEVIPLSLGDPTVFGNFKTPEILVNAIKTNLDDYSCNGYVHSAGMPSARAAIAARYTTEVAPLTEDDVVIASGCSGALDLAITCLCNEKSNILVPRPGFALYATLAMSKGVDVRHYSLLPDKRWEADLAELESLIDENTSAMVVNNPSNPCGSVYTEEHLRAILAIAERHRIPVIADEIYGNMVFSGSEFFPMATLTDTVPIIAAGGIAKEFLVPGWRVGWLLIHDKKGAFAEVKPGLMRLSQLILGATAIVQSALPAILAPEAGSADAAALEAFHAETTATLEKHARFTVEAMTGVPGLKVVEPQGAMYVMIGIDPAAFKDIADDMEFTQKLLTEESVFMLPGKAFMMPMFARIVFSVSPTDALCCLEFRRAAQSACPSASVCACTPSVLMSWS
jgi:tyrosine aminotransferase